MFRLGAKVHVGLATLATLCFLTGGLRHRSLKNEAQLSVSKEPVVPLTNFGSRIRTVVFSAITYEGVCMPSRHGGMDWRGLLPRFVARELGPNVNVLVRNAFDAARNESFVNDCELCRGDVPASRDKPSFSCRDWFESHQQQRADLVVVVGSGHRQCKKCISAVPKSLHGELKWTFKQPWVTKETTVLHIPISREESVLKNSVAPFTAVLPDGAWIKPVHLSEVEAWRKECRRTVRSSTLLYVARYHEWKGQLTFLRTVNPRQLKGYTIEFYSGMSNQEMEVEMRQIGRDRGIRVIVHTEPADRKDLFKAMCGAKGAVHWAKTDANPRVIYEFLMAEIPVLMSRESRVPRSVQRQPFIISTKYDDRASLERGMDRFMNLVKNRESSGIESSIGQFIETELVEDKALGNICMMMGICNRTEV